MTDAELLDQHRQGSQAAFTELMRRHINWVYSVARRRMHDEHLAEDMTQAAFITLARKPPRLWAGSPLSPWLLKVINLTCKAALRSESNRRRRETEAAKMRSQIIEVSESAQWKEIAPHIDEFVLRLGTTDRNAVMLRFYEQKNFAEVGATMHITEEAARKRVSRAIEKLRDIATKHDMNISASVISGFLLSELAWLAPPRLLEAISINPLARATTFWVTHRKLIWFAPVVALPLIVTAIIVLLQLNPNTPPANNPQETPPTTLPAAAVLSKAQIAAAVRAQRAKIQNFSVAFRFDDITPQPNDLVLRQHTSFLFMGDKLYVEQQTSIGPTPPNVSPVRISYDGKRTTQFAMNQAIISDGISPSRRASGIEFFGVAMLSPAGATLDLDLPTILGSDKTTIRPQLESVGDRACYVLDAAPHLNEKDTIWLDPQRGFAPLRIAIMYEGNLVPTIEFQVDKLAEISDGFWLPVEATKIVLDNEGSQLVRLVSRMKVDTDPNGKPAIKINSSVPDNQFNLLDQLPPGTQVLDSNAKKSWITEPKK